MRILIIIIMSCFAVLAWRSMEHYRVHYDQCRLDLVHAEMDIAELKRHDEFLYRWINVVKQDLQELEQETLILNNSVTDLFYMNDVLTEKVMG